MRPPCAAYSPIAANSAPPRSTPRQHDTGTLTQIPDLAAHGHVLLAHDTFIAAIGQLDAQTFATCAKRCARVSPQVENFRRLRPCARGALRPMKRPMAPRRLRRSP